MLMLACAHWGMGSHKSSKQELCLGSVETDMLSRGKTPEDVGSLYKVRMGTGKRGEGWEEALAAECMGKVVLAGRVVVDCTRRQSV
jgi:hypothetical protein